MSKINRLPKGLQEFLGNTAQGQNPDELSQTVVPTLEMQQYHALDQMKWVQATRTITTIGNGAFFPVPTNEIWRPIYLSGNMTGLEEGDDIRLEIAVFDPAGNRHTLGYGPAYSQPAYSVLNARYAFGFTWPMQILHSSGWIFSVIANDINFTQPSETLTAQFAYIRMRG